MAELEQQDPDSAPIQKLELDEIYHHLKELPLWSLFQSEKIPYIQAEFKFKDFITAQKFANEIGNLAETHNHHPKIVIEWGKTEVAWWSHNLKGIQKKDLILAAKTTDIYNRYFGSI